MSQNQRPFKPHVAKNSSKSLSEPENGQNSDYPNNKRPTNIESERLLATEMFKRSNNNNNQNKKQSR